MDKKNKKMTIALIILGILLLSGICIFLYFAFREDDNEIKYNNPKRIAEKYVRAILEGDYATAYKYIYMPQDMISSKKDYEEFIKTKKYYNDLEGKKYKDIVEISTESYQVLLSDKDDNILKINVDLIERTINDFRVDEGDFIIPNVKITVPKGTTVKVNDFELDENYIDGDSTYTKDYLIPNISKSKKHIILDNVFGSKEEDIELKDEDNEFEFTIDLNKEEMKNKAYNFVKNAWNDMYNNYKKKKKVSTIKKYFDSKFTTKDLNKIYKTAFKKITKGRTQIGEYNSYKITKMIDNPEEDNVVKSNEYIRISFGYTLNWKWKYLLGDSAVKMSMNRYSSVVLKYDGQNFKFYDIIDNHLFDYANQYTRDFK